MSIFIQPVIKLPKASLDLFDRKMRLGHPISFVRYAFAQCSVVSRQAMHSRTTPVENSLQRAEVSFHEK